jgi:integrase
MGRSTTRPDERPRASSRSTRSVGLGGVQGSRFGSHGQARSGGKLVLLGNAIECFLLLASSERRLSSTTLKAYTTALSKLEAFAQTQKRPRLEQLTPNLLRGAAMAEMSTEPTTRTASYKGGEVMAALVVTATRTMIRRLGEEFPDLPLPDLSMVKAPRIPKRIQTRLEEGEYVRLEAALRLRLLRDRVPRFLIARDMAILAVLGNTGLRAAECCGLDVEDVDLQEGILRVRRAKGGKWRILSIRDPEDDARDGGEVMRGVADYLRWRERTFALAPTRALWLTIRGHRLLPEGLRRALQTICDEAGIDGSRPPHAFRRAYFTDQYQTQPTALPVLIERMGWQSPEMAKVYTRGVDIELARRIPLPLSTRKWRRTGPSTQSRKRVAEN